MNRISDRSPGSCSRLSPLTVFAASLLLFSSAGAQSASSQTQAAQSSHSTVVIFSDNPLSAGQWMFLFAQLRAGMARGGPDFQSLDRSAVFLRGERAASADIADPAVTVYLHGNCDLEPAEHRTSIGHPLGWVHRVNGRVEPFVHIDCTQIGHVLGARERWQSRQGRDQAMALAISRVFFHEWIHIATQSARHAETGIAKAAFDIPDLIREEPAASPYGPGR